MKVASLMIDLSANVARLRADMSRAQGVMNKSLGAIEKSVESAMANARRAAALFASSLALVGAGFSLGKVIETVTGFQDSMLRLQATSRATASEMAEMEKQARSLGATTRYSAGQAADAQNFLAMAGFNTSQILSATGEVIQFASAASIDLAKSADIASNVLGQMRLPVSELTGVMDTLINTSQSSNTNVTQLADALAYVGPVATAAGINIDELSAAIGVLGDAGIQGGRAGTGLQGVIQSLINVTPAATKVLAGYGLTVKDVDITAHGLTTVLGRLDKANLSAGDSLAIFGQVAAASALNLSAAKDRVKELSEANAEAAGRTKEVANLLDSGLSAAFASVSSAIEEMMLRAGDSGLTKVLQVLAITTAGVINEFNGLLPEFAEASGITDEFEGRIKILATTIKAVGAGLGVLALTAIPSVVAGITAMTAALMTNPLGLLAVGAAVVVAYFISIRDEVDKFNQEIDAAGAAWDVYSDIFMGFWGGVLDFLRPIFGGIFDWFGDVWDRAVGATDAMEKSFDAAFGAIASGLDYLFGSFVGTMAALGALVSASASNLKNYFLKAFDAVVAGTVGMVNKMIDGLNSVNPFEKISHIEGFKTQAGDITNLFDKMAEASARAKKENQLGLRAAYDNAKANRALKREYDELIDANDEYWNGTKGSTKATGQLTEATNNNTTATAKNSKAVEEAIKRAKEFAKARESEFKSQRDGISSIHLQAQALEDQVAVFGRGKTALDQLAIARLQEQKAMLSGFSGSQEAIDLIDQEIAAIERRTKATGALEVLEAEKKKNEEMVSEWNKTVEEYDRVFRDGFAGMINDGKDGWKSFTKSLATTFKTSVADQVYKLFAQPFIAKVAVSIASGMGMSGVAQAAEKTLAGSSGAEIGGLGWLTNFGGSVGQTVSEFGQKLFEAEGALSSFGKTLMLNGESIGQFADMAGDILGYGNAIYSMTKGNYGAGIGAAAGQYFGGPIGSFVGSKLGSMLDKSFKGETRSGGGFGYNVGQDSAFFGGGPSGGYGGQQTLDVMTQVLKGQADLIQSVLTGTGVNANVAHVAGAFESSDKGRGGTFSGGWLDVDGESVQFGTDKKGQGYGDKSGTVEEMFANMEKDLAYSALEAFQVVGNQMPKMISDMLSGLNIRALSPEQAQSAVGEIQAIVTNVNLLMSALNELPFTSLSGLSFDLTASLLEAASSMESLVGGINAYYQGFYSEQERFDIAANQLGGAISELGFELPTTRDGFRGLVESLDATDEANHKAIAGLFEMSGAATQYYDYIEERAQEAVELEMERAGKMSAFRDAFYSEQERERLLINELTQSMASLGHTLPDSRKGFRALVDSIDATTESGKMAVDSLLSMTGAADAFYTELEKQADDAVKKAQDTARNITSAAQDIANAFTKATDFIQSNVGNLYERIQLDIMKDDGERYGYHKQTFDDLARQLSQSTDMNQIQDLVSKMTSSASNAYNLLDEDVRKGGKGQEYLNTLDQIQREADARLEVAKSQAAQDKERELKVVGEAIAKEVVKIMSGAGDSMKEAAGDISGAAQEFSYAIGTLALSKYNEVT